ncbi:hypothetical protein GF361_05000 [Candidatus Woesearchaeota archaeon]|nr:hypothetical protein [Candidatus Woesearchaeota archaeon]
MKKIVIIILAFFILVSGCINEGNEIKSKKISPELAEFAAKEYLPKYYSGDYEVLGRIKMYDLGGEVTAYAFIFKKSGFKVNNLEEMKSLVEETEGIPEKYFTRETATVVVSAVNTISPLHRTYTGLPGIFVLEKDIEDFIREEYPEYNKGRIIFLNPFDIVYEASKQSDIDKKPLSSDSLLISTGKIDEPRKVSDLRHDLEERERREEKQLAQMNKETRREFLEMQRNKIQANIDKWNEFEERFQLR